MRPWGNSPTALRIRRTRSLSISVRFSRLPESVIVIQQFHLWIRVIFSHKRLGLISNPDFLLFKSTNYHTGSPYLTLGMAYYVLLLHQRTQHEDYGFCACPRSTFSQFKIGTILTRVRGPDHREGQRYPSKLQGSLLRLLTCCLSATCSELSYGEASPS